LCEFLARVLVCLWWYLLFVRSCFCLSCVEPLPLSKGTETFLLQVILLFAFPLAFDRLLKFLLVVSFLLFSLWLQIMCVVNALIKGEIEVHYVKTSNRSCNICNGPLTPVTSTHICNSCCLTLVTYKRARTTPGLVSTTPVINVGFW
jgi:hypothetical protein